MLAKQENRLRRKARVRSQILGTAKRPRLSVFRSTTHIYAQLVDDTTGKTLGASSDLKITKGSKIEKAAEVGTQIAQIAKDLKLKEIVFDRG